MLFTDVFATLASVQTFSALYNSSIDFLSSDGNGTVITLVALLATVLYFRQRQRRNENAANVIPLEPVLEPQAHQPPPGNRGIPIVPPDS
jgi:hypothetical protein